MSRCSISLSIALLMASTAVIAAQTVSSEHAWPLEDARPQAEFQLPGYSSLDVATLRLGSVEQEKVAALKRFNAQPGRKSLRVGVERRLQASTESLLPKLIWRATADGGSVAQLAVTSPGAAALRLGLRIEELPLGAELRFASATDSALKAPMYRRDEVLNMARSSPLVWTPLTEGDQQRVEIYLPPKAERRWLRLSVSAVSHLLVMPGRPYSASKIGESEACQRDAKCLTNPPESFVASKAGVTSMVFESGEGSAVCTGTLLNDTDASTQAPWLYSAAHCFNSQSVASTLTTLWFYEATACGSGVQDASTTQVAGGAQMLYADTPSDVLFLRLNNPAPNGALYMGWSAAPVQVGAEFLVLHHPAGDALKYSMGTVTGLAGSTLASGQFIQVRYSNTPTEGGSSGSGLLTSAGSAYLLRGGLLGGSSACDNAGSESPDNSDDYSRFDLAFPSVKQYLAPETTTPPPSTDYSGAWSNPAEDGWGLVVVRGSSGTYAMYIYHYGEQSTPSWYLSFGALSGGNAYSAPTFSFTGPWFGIVPFNPGMVSNRQSGTLTVNFTSATAATISFTIDGKTASSSLTKLAF